MSQTTTINQPTKAQVEITVRCKPFSGQPAKEHRVMVDDVNVRVYDSVAGYFTLCHSLSAASVKRIIRRAAGD